MVKHKTRQTDKIKHGRHTVVQRPGSPSVRVYVFRPRGRSSSNSGKAKRNDQQQQRAAWPVAVKTAVLTHNVNKATQTQRRRALPPPCTAFALRNGFDVYFVRQKNGTTSPHKRFRESERSAKKRYQKAGKLEGKLSRRKRKVCCVRHFRFWFVIQQQRNGKGYIL